MNRRLCLLGISAASVSAITAPAFATSSMGAASLERAGFSTERLARLDEVMQGEIDAGKYAAINIAIARRGRTVYNRCFGFQSLATHAPLRADAIFRIASMTKPVVGVALMILFEEGKWQLDDPVARYIPEFANLRVATAHGDEPIAHPITMREILTSTAGFAAGYSMGSSNPSVDDAYAQANLRSGTLEDMIVKLSRLPLETQPGTRFRYGIQHDIQGALVERISGQQLDRFLQDHLFGPLGMVDTGFGVSPEQRSRLVPLYAYDTQSRLVLAEQQGAFTPTADQHPSFLSGAGGLYSTMSDYMRFAQMIANGGALGNARILSPSTVHLMTSNLLPEGVKLTFMQPLEEVGYGADLGIVLDPGRATFNSGGIGQGSLFWTGSHGTWFWIDPINDLIVLGMTQQAGAAAAHIGLPTPAPDLRAISRSLVYQALVAP